MVSVTEEVSPSVSLRLLRELDHAMLRRLEKRIMVGLPSGNARQAMVSHWLPPLSCTGGVELRTELAYEMIAQVGGRNSGISHLC